MMVEGDEYVWRMIWRCESDGWTDVARRKRIRWMSMTEYLGMRWLGQREMEGAGEVEVYEKGVESPGCQRREKKEHFGGSR